MPVLQYLKSRIPTLKPPMDKVVSPWTAMRMMSGQQWNFFMVNIFFPLQPLRSQDERDLFANSESWQCAWLAWIIDALDFFTVSLTITPLAKEFNKQNSDITWGITLVLMFRSLGSAIFGIWSDRFGRKWPFIFNNFLFIVIELGTGFCKTYGEFIACRAIFGVAMGGLYGNAVATALEDLPDKSRGVMSGFFQAGYPMGYLLATAFARALVDTTPQGWRSLFWFSAGPPVLAIVWRYFLPETNAFIQRRTLHESNPSPVGFIHEGLRTIRKHWLTLIYMVVLMAGINFVAHGAQDFYPTMLINQFGFTSNQMTITQVVANLGAISGALVVGYISEIMGRRITIISSCLCAAALIYPYTHVTTMRVAACAFFTQFFVQGSFAVIPAYRWSSHRSRVAEQHYALSPSPSGVKRYDYAIVICAFLGACLALVTFTTLLGPENKGRQFGGEDEIVHAENTDKSHAGNDKAWTESNHEEKV